MRKCQADAGEAGLRLLKAAEEEKASVCLLYCVVYVMCYIYICVCMYVDVCISLYARHVCRGH